MVSLLSNSGFRDRALPISVGTWHWMVQSGLAPARAELLRGVIVEKMPKSPIHTKLATRIWNDLSAMAGDGFWVRKEEPLTLADSEPEPDIAVVTGTEAEYQTHPSTALLVVEISVTTLAEDRELASLYAEAGVSEYWIVNATARVVEIYRQPHDGHYQIQETVPEGGTLSSRALPSVHIPAERLFANLKPAGEVPQ